MFRMPECHVYLGQFTPSFQMPLLIGKKYICLYCLCSAYHFFNLWEERNLVILIFLDGRVELLIKIYAKFFFSKIFFLSALIQPLPVDIFALRTNI